MKLLPLMGLLTLPSTQAVQFWQADFPVPNQPTVSLVYNDTTHEVTVTATAWQSMLSVWNPPGADTWLDLVTQTIPVSYAPQITNTSTTLWTILDGNFTTEQINANFYVIPEPKDFLIGMALALIGFAIGRKL